MPDAELGATTAGTRRLAIRLTAPPPWLVLGGLVVAQWVLLGAVARSVMHDGWLYYDGGDGSWYYTTAWVLGEGRLPQTAIGYGYSFLIAPLAWIAGPSRLDGVPYVVVFNAVVLSPVALLCVYGIARGIAGRAYAYVVTSLWVLVPVLAIPYFYESFRSHYVDLALPSAVGLTTNGDYPSMVLLLVTAYFLFRVFGPGTSRDALAAGLALGFALAIKPANALFLPAVAAGLLLARRPRHALVVAGGLVPALVGLVAWKYRGLGELPVLGESAASAAGRYAMHPVAGLDLGRYFDLNWEQLERNLDGFREYTRSRRLLQWSLVAGAVGLGRRSLPLAALVGVWLAMFTIFKGTQTGLNLGSGSLLPHMIAAFPAVFLLLVAVPLLIPVWGGRLVEAGRRSMRSFDPRLPTASAAAIGGITLAFLPLVLVLSPLTEPRAAIVVTVSQYAPANAFPISATAEDGAVSIEWPAQDSGGSQVGYTVFRGSEDWLQCEPRAHAASTCSFLSDATFPLTVFVGSTTGTSMLDRPPPGRWVYRVAARAGPGGEAAEGDFILLSDAGTVDVPP